MDPQVQVAECAALCVAVVGRWFYKDLVRMGLVHRHKYKNGRPCVCGGCLALLVYTRVPSSAHGTIIVVWK